MEENDIQAFLEAEIEAYDDAVDEAANALLSNTLSEFVQFANGIIDEHLCDADEIAQEHFDKINAELHYLERELCATITGETDGGAAAEFSERFQLALDEAIGECADFPFFTFRRDGRLLVSIEGE